MRIQPSTVSHTRCGVGRWLSTDLASPPDDKSSGYMTAPDKSGLTSRESPIYRALLCSTGIYARVDWSSLYFETLNPLKIKTYNKIS